MKTILAVVILAFGTVWLFWHFKESPPSETAIIADFHAHQSTYERLKLFLQEDSQLSRIADWGVETAGSPVPYMPPKGGFPQKRFEEYLALLKEVHGLGASRTPGPHPNLCILVWAWGWAADTEHIAVCWREQVPGGQVPSIDNLKMDSSNSGGQRQFAYRKIEDNWYLQKDW